MQLAGGGYLLYLALRHLLRARDGEPAVKTAARPVTRAGFWRTVVTAEIVDLAFAVDSALVAVAFTHVLWVIYVGVFLGILLLRLAAGWFVGLLERYPRFELVAYGLVGWAGVKLVVEGWTSLAERVLGQPGLALDLPKWTFWVVTVVLLAAGTTWALRGGRTRVAQRDAVDTPDAEKEEAERQGA